MAVGLQQFGLRKFSVDPPERNLSPCSFRSYSTAWGLSLFVHLGILLLLGLWIGEQSDPAKTLETSHFQWTEELTIPTFETTESNPTEALKTEAAEQSALTAVFNASSSVSTVEPVLRTTLLPAPEELTLSPAALTEYVGALTGLSKAGDGDGLGAGDGLFGSTSGANSFVFVLDRSRSMNQPHQFSDQSTRFERLQQELIGFINRLEPSQSFFVIFFDEQTIPMPAEGMVPATDANKLRYLNWVRKLTPDGRTDPRVAIKMAIKLAPEQIFFLSDGELDPNFQKQILKHPPGKSALNSYSFGMHGGEFMKVLAEKHGGQYTFIP